jgi:hypothetical protein
VCTIAHTLGDIVWAAVCREHRGHFEAFMGMEFDTYVSLMSLSGTWGDELTLKAASEAFGLVLTVVTSASNNW